MLSTSVEVLSSLEIIYFWQISVLVRNGCKQEWKTQRNYDLPLGTEDTVCRFLGLAFPGMVEEVSLYFDLVCSLKQLNLSFKDPYRWRLLALPNVSKFTQFVKLWKYIRTIVKRRIRAKFVKEMVELKLHREVPSTNF